MSAGMLKIDPLPVPVAPAPLLLSSSSSFVSPSRASSTRISYPPTPSSAIPLQSFEPNLSSSALSSNEIESTPLPAPDTSRQALLFLVSATMIELLVWGLPFSVGVLHEYWITTKFEGRGAEGTLTLAATLQTGLMYMAAVIQGPIIQAYPHRRRYFQFLGLIAGATSFIGSAFVTEPWQLVITLGLIYPISGFLYMPAATLLFEWFVEKRGRASGIMYAGTGVGGFVFPFMMKGLIDRFGYEGGMCGVAAAFALLSALSIPYCIPRIPVRRLPPGSTSVSARKPRNLIRLVRETLRGEGPVNTGFLRRSTFYAFTGSILLSSMSNFVPAVYIPSYASDLKITKPNGTALLAIMNGASVPGLLLLGYLTDKYSLRMVISLSCFGSALSCLFLWGFATNTAALITFVIVFGLLGMSFSAIWTKLIGVIAKDDPALPPLIFSLFAASRGIGNISSGPVSSALLKYSSMTNSAAGAYGFRSYGPLLIYSGIMMFAGGVCGIVYRN